MYSSGLQPSKTAMLLQKAADLCLEKGICFNELNAHVAALLQSRLKKTSNIYIIAPAGF